MQKAKLRRLLTLSLLVLAGNVVEKRTFGFEVAFGHVKSAFGQVSTVFASADTASFYLIAAFVFLWLLTMVLLLSEGRPLFIATGLIGLVFVAEVHQLSYLIRGEYYPGMVTG